MDLCSPGMNLQQLRYLVAVADCGSVSAAARSLHLSQPVISRALRAFEIEHEVDIFCLRGRRLVPTEAGITIVGAARDALLAIENVEEKTREVAGRSELVIATTPTNGLLLTAALRELGRRVPALEIKVRRACDAADVLRQVEEGEAEIGFSELTAPREDGRLLWEPVAEMEVVLISPRGSDLPPSVTWDDVVTQRLIVPPEGSERRALIDDVATKETGSAPPVSVIIEDRGSWMAAAQAGMGSFLSYRAVVAEYDGIDIRPFAPPQTVSVGFTRRSRAASRAAAHLMELSRAALKPIKEVRA
jgi:DNA-binding transcriptional LysR family regulator